MSMKAYEIRTYAARVVGPRSILVEFPSGRGYEIEYDSEEQARLIVAGIRANGILERLFRDAGISYNLKVPTLGKPKVQP